MIVVDGVLAASIGAALLLYRPPAAAAPPLATPTVSVEGPDLSSEKPELQAVLNHSVAPDLPKYIAIPAIGVADVRIFSMGLLPNSTIKTPTNIYDAGWYEASAKPGAAGVMFIFGHVSNMTNNGIFKDLKKITTGDTVVVTGGDNKTYRYTVTGRESSPVDQIAMQTILTPRAPGTSELALMTCDGTYDPRTQTFSKRLVVFARLEQK